MSGNWYRFEPLAEVWENPTPANRRRSRYTFKAAFSETLALLRREIETLDPSRSWAATEVVLSVACRPSDVRRDGGLRADARAHDHPGVRVSFSTEKLGPLSYATDVCDLWQHNVRSIALGLEALRAVDRYGISQGAQQYVGFKALPAGRAMPASHMTRRDAMVQIAKIAHPDGSDYTRADALLNHSDGEALDKLIRRAKSLAHPDRRGGDQTLWDALEAAATVLGRSL